MSEYQYQPPKSNRNFWIGLAFCAGAAALLIALGMLMMGLPGGLLVAVFSMFYSIFTGTDPQDVMPADAAWPFAILVTIIYPLFIVPSYVAAFLPAWKLHIAIRIAIFLALMLILAILLPAVIYFTMV
jgi:hypothetical protein